MNYCFCKRKNHSINAIVLTADIKNVHLKDHLSIIQYLDNPIS